MPVSNRLFDIFMLPLERMVLRRFRRRFIPRAKGRILELGGGTGVNIPYYRQEERPLITITDQAPHNLLKQRAKKYGLAAPVSADAEALPFPDDHFDTVLFTLLFCSVTLPRKGIEEILRVLKPGGQIIYIEHTAACHPGIRRVQDLFTPAWRRIASNCHLNRDTEGLLLASGLNLIDSKQSAFCLIRGGIAKRAADG